jgi:hypothetical protein
MLPTEDEIRRRAYEIWQREGRPEGREAEHWRMAVEELSASPVPTDTQEVPATRVRGPAKLDESRPQSGVAASRSEATGSEAGNAPPAPGPDAQGDPLGLAQPAKKAAPRKRTSRGAKSRAQPDASSPPDTDTKPADRTR